MIDEEVQKIIDDNKQLEELIKDFVINSNHHSFNFVISIQSILDLAKKMNPRLTEKEIGSFIASIEFMANRFTNDVFDAKWALTKHVYHDFKKNVKNPPKGAKK